MRIDWTMGKADPYAEEDSAQANFMRELRKEFEHHISILDKTAKQNGWPVDPVGDRQVSASYCHREFLDPLYQTGMIPEIPKYAAFYSLWALKSTGHMVLRLLVAVGMDRIRAEKFANDYDQLKGIKFKPAADLPNPKIVSVQAKLLADVREYRERWEWGHQGSEAYRNPLKSLPDERPDLLSAALQFTSNSDPTEDSGLSEEDVAYCIFSACFRGREYASWLAFCKNSKRSAEAMLDLVSLPDTKRPVLRAAWCLSKFEPSLRVKATHHAKGWQHNRDDGILELLEAINEDRVMTHIEAIILTESWGDETWKAKKVLEEIQRTANRRGARGVLDLPELANPYSVNPNDDVSPQTSALHTALNDALQRFQRKPRDGGGYNYFLSEHFARVASAAAKASARLDGNQRAFLLRGAIYAQHGHGFGIFNFLPNPTDTWPLPVLAEYLRQDDYRTPRYHSALILQYLTFTTRDQFVRDHLSRSRYKRVSELCQAIATKTVQQFVDDPKLCYDFLPEEGIKRLALKATAANLRLEYA